MRADFHVHSTASDGTCSPRELISLAQAARLGALAIADHDSVDGLAEAAAAAADTQLTLVPAVELSAVAGNVDIHILAYFIDASDPGLRTELADLRLARLNRARAMTDALSSAGYPVTIEDVLVLSAGGAVGRSHVARALVHSGAAESVSDAFERLIGRGRPFYIPKDSRSPETVISAMRALGALTVIAHPGVTGCDNLIPGLVDAGLQGVEAYHADHTPAQREHYARLAERYGVLVTGGSDFHGTAAPNPPLGSIDIPSRHVEALLRAGHVA